jgi:hypothetical protein
MKLKNLQTKINTATTDITEAYYNEKVIAKSTNKNVSDGLLNSLIKSASVKFDIPIESIKKQTIYSRICQKKPHRRSSPKNISSKQN